MRISDWSSDVCSSDLPTRSEARACTPKAPKRSNASAMGMRSDNRGRAISVSPILFSIGLCGLSGMRVRYIDYKRDIPGGRPNPWHHQGCGKTVRRSNRKMDVQGKSGYEHVDRGGCDCIKKK